MGLFGKKDKAAQAGNGAGGRRTQAIPHVAAPAAGSMEANAQVRKLSRIAGLLAALAVAGLGFGVSAVATTNATLEHAQADQKTVVVAKADVKAGTKLTAEQVELQSVPAAYRTGASLESADAVVGKLATVDIAKGQQLSAADFGGGDASSSLSARVSSGKVAVCVDLATAEGFSGELLVGDKLSVYDTKEMADQGPDIAALTDDATVVALGGKGDNSAESYTTATLEVSASQAKAITSAKADGGVSLVLHPRASVQHE